jgi:hypothetical protein
MKTDINAEKKLAGEVSAEEQKPSAGEQLKGLQATIETKQQEIEKLTGSSKKTEIELKEAREQLGLPPVKNESPNILADKKTLEKLQAEQELLKKQKQELINVAWEKILSNFPDKLQQEFRHERQNPTQDDIEGYESLHLLDPNPTSVSLTELLEKNGDYVLMCQPDVIEEINKKWGTKFDASLSKVYDPNPGRVRKYSHMPAETAEPSVMIDGEIHFGVGRFIAALLREDSELKVWNLSKKQ